MAKFIDSEYLKRILQRVVEHLKEKGADKEVRVIEAGIKFLKVMERFHSVDVVRCKDCKHFWESFSGTHSCKLHKGLVGTKYDTFCSYGERRTDERKAD